MTYIKQDHDEFFLDPELHAYVDGKLPPERMAIVEARLSGDRELGQAVDGWAQARTLIRAAASSADDAPADMRTELLARELSARVRRARLRGTFTGSGLRQMAASVAIFAAGWAGHALFAGDGGFPGTLHETNFLQTVVSDAGGRFALSNPFDHRVAQGLQELSTAIGGTVSYPSLEHHGLTLASAAVSEGPEAPVVRLNYVTAAGRQVSVVIMKHPEGVPEYPYQVRAIEGQVMAYLTRRGLDYAISGEEDPVALATLASALP